MIMAPNPQSMSNAADTIGHSGAVAAAAAKNLTIAKVFAGLSACCLVLTFLVGDIGFQGDDWWILSWPFWHGLIDSIWLYAKASLRPLEGIYWISIFEAFGFHRQAFYFCSLLLSAGACTVMGACLLRAFPGRRDLAVLSSFFAFFLPTVAPLTYLIHTDNSRLALLLFWCSVLAFQRWAATSGTWSGLMVPVLLYCLAALTYENGTFLIFAVPFLVWPVHARSRRDLLASGVLFRLFVGVCGAFALFVFIRFIVFSGGAVGHRSLVPPLHLFVAYAASLGRYVATPFMSISSDGIAWLWGIGVAAIAGWLLFLDVGKARADVDAGTERSPGSLYVAGTGALVLALGMLPYLLAGYTPELGFTSQSRVYSSGSFGLAILLALGSTFWKSAKALVVAKAVSVVALLFMAVFMADLSKDWQQAAQLRRQLCAQLIEQVPDVQPGTTFLFLDLQSYVSNRAVIMQGTDGLNEFIKMMYHKKPVSAYFLYKANDRLRDKEGKTATVSPQGVVPRGRLSSDPVPLDNLLILRKTGSRLALVDSISRDEDLAAINWQGVSSIHSNLGRILRNSVGNETFRDMCLK
jgi:hypothetical protein